MPVIPTDTNLIPTKSAKKPLKTTPKEPSFIKDTLETNPFRQLILNWLSNCRVNGLSDRTIADYKDKTFKFLWWWSDYTCYAKTIGEHPKNVSIAQVKEYAAYLRTSQSRRWGIQVPQNRQQLAVASIESYARAVKVFFNWLETEDIIVKTPFNKSVKFTSHKKDRTIKTITSEDIKTIFEYLTREDKLQSFLGCRDLAIISLFYDSGIRLGGFRQN